MSDSVNGAPRNRILSPWPWREDILDRADMIEGAGKPLESGKWAGCVDSVGSVILARALAQMKYSGTVATVGLAGGADLPTTVIPFILRGVSLLGIDLGYGTLSAPDAGLAAFGKRFTKVAAQQPR